MDNNNCFKKNKKNNNKKKQNKPHNDQNRRNGRGRNNNRKFQKIPDIDYRNYESKSWTENNWNSTEGNNKYYTNESAGGIFPWIRKKPANPLIIPQHINFEHNERDLHGNSLNNRTSEPKEINDRTFHEDAFYSQNELGDNRLGAENPFNNSTCSGVQRANERENRDMSTNKDRQNSQDEQGDIRNTSNKTPSAPELKEHTISCAKPGVSIIIKQENDSKINIKRENRSSSSSSSSSESSSSEDDPAPTKTAVIVKPEISVSKSSTTALDIRLKPRATSLSSTPSQRLKTSAPTSSSSSSSDEESQQPSDKKKMEGKETLKQSPSTIRKPSSEDDVVCIGKVENKVVLEDESNSSEEESESEQETSIHESSKKIKNKSSERCMICDKKDHTSFQCQMICKNCSAPYHGYRTCPHPANLNTMMQLFMEFCMQQLQSFHAENYNSTNNADNVHKPKIESSLSACVANKPSKHKRKLKTNSSNKKHKTSKKRRISTAKKSKSKASSDESSDNDNEDGSDSQTSSTETNENLSDSSAESLVSSKKKRKIKNKNASKAALDLSNFTANPVNLPIVLNGFPNLTGQASNIHNPTTSTNALNTLLLTQMFQNAIGSLKK